MSVLFDEATSALDNRTQAIVSVSLERLQATRIVIAHRLSTIINADRIFVMQDGKIVQSGRYQELMPARSLFGTCKTPTGLAWSAGFQPASLIWFYNRLGGQGCPRSH